MSNISRPLNRYLERIDPRLQLRNLRYFVAVAEELHFGRAAARLGIAQPPLSQQIQRLESLIGASLFDRTSRQVKLTDAGRVLLEECQRVFGSVYDALEATRRAARGESGTVSVAFAASVMFRTLPTMVRNFRERFPDVRLELRELPTALQLSALRSGKLDVGFVREPAPDEALRMETVIREPLMVAMPKTHRLASRKRVEPRELKDEDFVLFPPDLAPGLHAQVLALCRRADFAPRVVQESRELYTTISLVEAGVGLTIVPASIRKMGWRGAVYRPLPMPEAQTRIDMAWRADLRRPAVHSFIELVRSMVEEKG